MDISGHVGPEEKLLRRLESFVTPTDYFKGMVEIDLDAKKMEI